ncbi:cupin domain-containing protein [Calidifontibacter sp. DB0510]|uniref:Cupin domain-containing protein n=1 Tax=Metallococcus carri TaxID=1656884 RepID=A0A967ED00_9MICO|nr:cupin domain-containing protein [Metallococcus carri]NHN54226.1 cupin domain-containing protein [Metallococcus carri]NOP36934.1 cupin domain-containing protein [Calidifontibacter sp. DB2511S]
MTDPAIPAPDAPGQPLPSPELADLYRGFDKEQLVPLWTEIGELMPAHPRSRAQPHRWSWRELLGLAERAGTLVPVGRGGERRAIALANPGLGGMPFATPTLWAAIQYLMPGEDAPEHRHTQNAFRFVVEGEGVWTVVEGDPVPMRRGDFLPQPGWSLHAHHNAATTPMAWIDGLDIPFQCGIESQFFEFGRDRLDAAERTTPARSRSEHLWSHPGLRPVSKPGPTAATPLLCYRWEHTDAALTDQLRLEHDGDPGTLEPGHAAVRYVSPTTGADVLPTIRAEFHRIVRGVETAPRREAGSSVYQVFDGSGSVTVGQETWRVARGDLFVVPSWQPLSIRSEASASDSDSGALDLFQFTDAPIFEALGLARSTEGDPR